MYNINILPEKYRNKKKVKFNLANPTYGLAILGTILASSVFLGVQLELRTNSVEKEIALLDNELAEIEQNVTTANQHISQIQFYKTEIQRMNQEEEIGNDYLMEELNNQTTQISVAWDYMLDEIAATTIPEATVTSIKQSTTDTQYVDITVETYTLSNMARMKQSFEDSKYFTDVVVNHIRQNNSNLIARPNEVSFTLSFKYLQNPNEPQLSENADPNMNMDMQNGYTDQNPYAIENSNFDQGNGLSEVDTSMNGNGSN